jgi:hypothetical protein
VEDYLILGHTIHSPCQREVLEIRGLRLHR